VRAWPDWHRRRLELEIVLAFVGGVVAFVLASLLGTWARSHVAALPLSALFLLAILAVARVGGILYTLPIGVASVLAFDWYFLPPLRKVDAATILVLALFLAMSVIVGGVEAHLSRQASASERARELLAEEQAALRRVATLVARGTQPDELSAAVADEIARVLEVDGACIVRYDDDGMGTVVATQADTTWSPVGSRWTLDGKSVIGTVFRSQRPARMDSYSGAPAGIAAVALPLGSLSSVGAPIVIGGGLWGAAVAFALSGPLPAGAEQRLLDFADLIAMAISNADARTELIASRARVVAAADETRRRLERDLHDGVQQRLVSLGLNARAIEAMASQQSGDVKAALSSLVDGLRSTLEEVREISRGIHPSILSEAGLGPALKGLARRSAVPVALDLNVDSRLSETVEVAAYYAASEAITNAIKHAKASTIALSVDGRGGPLRLSIRDDGIGGADPRRGSGIVGLMDRVEAVGGTISLDSPSGIGTTLHMQFPTT
jgi:signal transduction histidine kinase